MAVRTDRRVKKVTHNIVKGVLAIPRTSFILMLKANVWGLATVIRSAMKNADLKKKWQIAWYNLGGNFGDFNHAIIKGYTRKAVAIKLAPDKIKKFYKSAKSKVTGIGAEPASTLTIVSTALTVTSQVLGIIFKSLQFAASRAEIPEEDPEFKIEIPEDDYKKITDEAITQSSTRLNIAYVENYLQDPNNPIFYTDNTGGENNEGESNNNLLLLGAAAAALLLLKK